MSTPTTKEIHAIAMRLLREHYESSNPYMDDNPTGRADAARHRASCADCMAYARWLHFHSRGKDGTP